MIPVYYLYHFKVFNPPTLCPSPDTSSEKYFHVRDFNFFVGLNMFHFSQFCGDPLRLHP